VLLRKDKLMTTCLVVDDSGVIRKVVRGMMEGLGYSVSEAVDGLDALNKCQQGPMPEVILLDWNMPNMDGISFLRALRAVPGGEGPKVLFCTTETDMSYISQAIAAGADEYVMKPFDKSTLEHKLSEVGLA
jgi:two-component system chemotaxis response regulator CheY